MENIPVSTKTIIATSNAQFDIVKVFTQVPLDAEENNISLRLLYYQNQLRGDTSVIRKKKKKCFRNAVNVILQVGEEKLINFKLSKNGKFQLTGCRNEQHAMECVIFFMKLVHRTCQDALFLHDPARITVYFQTVMTNVDFSLGFNIDRKKLDMLLNQNTPYHSLLETSFGYTGVNIKFPLEVPWWTLPIPTVSCMTNDIESWSFDSCPLESIAQLTPDMKQKKRYNTFLVFHSGNVIMSGMTKETMETHYIFFRKLIQEWRNEIEEKILC